MPLPDRQTVDLATGQVSFRQAGSGPDLVLLHGLAGNARTFERQFDVFTDRYRVTAWDAPGYGASDPVLASVDSYADTLADFLKALGLEGGVLLGHSMGGVVAGNFAGRYPGRLRALVLSCSLLGRRQPAGAPLSEAYRARLADLDSLGGEEYGRRRAESMTAPGCDPAILDRLAGIAAETRRDGLEAAMRVIVEADNGSLLASLTLPVLVIAGEQDRTVTRDTTEALVAALASGRAAYHTTVLPGVGHAPYLENETAYIAAMDRFLKTVEAGAKETG